MVKKIMSILNAHQNFIFESPWKSLPDLTDAHGKESPFANQAQAWSIATIIEVVHDLTIKK